MDWEALEEAARGARERAWAPYSGFRVGAAVRTAEGAIHAGCNVENRTFGLTLCAERVAVASGVAAGARRFSAVVVLTDTSPPSPPCGLCLETLAEFADAGLPVALVNLAGERREMRLGDLLPHPFVLPSPPPGDR